MFNSLSPLKFRGERLLNMQKWMMGDKNPYPLVEKEQGEALNFYRQFIDSCHAGRHNVLRQAIYAAGQMIRLAALLRRR